MSESIDRLAFNCNIILEKLFYLYSKSMISRDQLLINSRLKAKFLLDNIDEIRTPEIKSNALKNLNILNAYLTQEERDYWFHNIPI